MRLVAGIEYDGRAYCGWQRLSHARSVQQELEKALSSVADHPVTCVCAGRTDSGVHAQQQVVHFDTEAKRPDHAWLLGGNSHLPDDISINWVTPVDDDFHARFRATARQYRYVISNRAVRPAILSGKVSWVRSHLDVEKMQSAGLSLLGEHDFSSFRASACEANTAIRHVTDLLVSRSGEFVYLDIQANAFLHHMVRNIAGVLISIGRGERSADWAGDLLAVRDRTRGWITAPADGLYLVTARYPSRWKLPSPPEPIRFG